MAAAEIRIQWRAAARAFRKLRNRRISPSTALRVLGRSSWNTTQLLLRLLILLAGSAVLAMLMIVVRLALRLALKIRRPDGPDGG